MAAAWSNPERASGLGVKWLDVQPAPSSCLLQRERSVISSVQGLRKPKRPNVSCSRFSLRGRGSARPWLPWGGGPELSEGGGSGPASDALPVDVPAEPPSALELRHPHLQGGQKGPRNLFC